MSAFLCNPYHIAELSIWAAKHIRDGTGDSSTTVARKLAIANLASVEYRYSDLDGKSAEFFCGETSNEAYIDRCIALAEARSFLSTLPNAAIGKMAHCFDYQACEHPNYKQGNYAYDLIRQIYSELVRQLPGYEDAPWEYHPKANAA